MGISLAQRVELYNLSETECEILEHILHDIRVADKLPALLLDKLAPLFGRVKPESDFPLVRISLNEDDTLALFNVLIEQSKHSADQLSRYAQERCLNSNELSVNVVGYSARLRLLATLLTVLADIMKRDFKPIWLTSTL